MNSTFENNAGVLLCVVQYFLLNHDNVAYEKFTERRVEVIKSQ